MKLSEQLERARIDNLSEWIMDRVKEAKQYESAIEAIRCLIDDSNGVDGLHLNGDLAPWDSLEEGGHFEEWLIEFNKAEELMAKKE